MLEPVEQKSFKNALKRAGQISPPFHLKWWRWFRLAVFLTLDLAAVGIAYWFAYLLRFDGHLPPLYQTVFLRTLPIVLLCHVIGFRFGGMSRQVWRYANLNS